jgi:hypothetical protein
LKLLQAQKHFKIMTFSKTLPLTLFACAALAACGAEPAPQPVETAAAAPAEPSLPAPNPEVFSATFAKACPSAKPVNQSSCRRAGMTSSDVICSYGLGEDEFLRHKATLTPGDGEWNIADPETICAQGA